MQGIHRLKFVVLQYAPSVRSNCFVNIAVLAYEVDTGSFGDAKFLDGWEPALKLDPNADIQMLNALKKEIREGWPNTTRRSMLLKLLLDSFSNNIQVSGEQSCLTDDPENEMRNLVLRYLSPTG
jgi:hypothetical protein